jgi:hypothetical protein
MIDGFGARDLVASDLLPLEIVAATPPGSFRLSKSAGPAAPGPVAILLEFEVES